MPGQSPRIRMQRLMDHLLQGWNNRYQLNVSADGALPLRLRQTTGALLAQLEQRYNLPDTTPTDPAMASDTFRAFRVLSHLRKIQAPAAEKDAAKLARWLPLFPAELLTDATFDPQTETEKLANAVSRLELELLGKWPSPMQRYLARADIRVGEPIPVLPQVSHYRQDKYGAIADLTRTLQAALQKNLDRLS